MRMEEIYVTCLEEVVKLHNKFGLSMMVFKAAFGLRMVIYVDKFGRRMVVYVALCLEIYLDMIELYVALCMVMLLYKVGLCMARCLEMMLYVMLRLEIYLDTVGLRMVVWQNFVDFIVMNVFLVALQNFTVFLATDVFMVALQNFLNYMVFLVTDVFMVEELWVSHQCRHHGKHLEVEVVEKLSCQRLGAESNSLGASSSATSEVDKGGAPAATPVDVELHNGCPYVAHEFGAKLLTVLEQHQIQQELKKMTLKSILTRGAAGLGNNMSIEMAMLVKLKEVMPTLPEDLALKLVPDLSVLTDPNIGLNLPWNRRKRKRLMMAKNVIIHMYSGPDASYWERRLSNEHTEVLCVDLEASTPSNALDETTFAFLLSLCASKRVKALLGGPPCRTTSALRFQKDDGPPILRTEDHPYGLPSLTPQQAELVTNDSILWLRLMLMYILCEEVRPKEQAQTAFLCEQPQDPAEYRKKEDVDEHQYFSMWRTQEWKSFQEAYNAKLISFDQGLQLLKQSADGSAVKRLHVKDLKILLALFTPKTMSDLLVSLQLEMKITLCLALMTQSSLVILKNNNLEMVNHLNNMLNEINNKRAMKLNMNKVFLQVLHKMNLILSKKNRPEDAEIRAAQVRSHGSRERVHAGAASAMSFLVGQTLLAEAEALEIKGEQDEADPLWIAAVVLMILGAIYAGKLAVQAGQCCMRRLQVWLSAPSTPSGEMQALSAVAEISGHAAAGGNIERALQRRAAEVSEALLGGERCDG
ncbi:unnamed protein product [Cladocopium goreaui]|uniref:Retrovirus-related Pol polyprotein from transposon TNT 1-94 n=1 Tax=Cladocopium goreaui TaxID=2562237 RepID=A0A9P1FXS6_9DINO|nr:unnamed protein product [Cladocopium goreaui]